MTVSMLTHYNPDSRRHAVDVLDGAGYDLVTLDKIGEGAISALPPKIQVMKRKTMVGDAGFEPATPAV